MKSHARELAIRRTGGVYIAVLGTALIVSVLGLTTMFLHRAQNRMLVESADIRQAQLNAESAVELALLTIKNNSNWRTSQPNGRWFTRVDLGAGLASVDVVDPIDGNLGDDPDEAIYLRAFGYRAPLAGNLRRVEADQRAELHLDPIREPLACLRNGQQNQGQPNWGDVFTHYQSNGTQLSLASLANRTPSFSRNPSLNDGTTHWAGGIDDLDLTDQFRDADQVNAGNFEERNAALQAVRNDWREGVSNRLNASLLKPNTRYEVRVEINPDFANILGLLYVTRFRITIVAKFLDGSTQVSPDSIVRELRGDLIGSTWASISGQLRTPAWTQPPSEIHLIINSNDSSNHHRTFYVDNLEVYESNARFIYQKVLSKDVNPLYDGAPLNAAGIYWIDCAGQKLVIERSRIIGTLLLLNPGPGSQIAYGPYDWSPSAPGYPALLVSGDFTISGTLASDTQLQEGQNGVNYNPPGAPDSSGNTDNDDEPHEYTDNYDSQLRGLVGISGNLTYQYNPPIRGQVVGPTVPAPPASFVYTPESLLSPPPGFYHYRYERRPASMKKVVRH